MTPDGAQFWVVLLLGVGVGVLAMRAQRVVDIVDRWLDRLDVDRRKPTSPAAPLARVYSLHQRPDGGGHGSTPFNSSR